MGLETRLAYSLLRVLGICVVVAAISWLVIFAIQFIFEIEFGAVFVGDSDIGKYIEYGVFDLICGVILLVFSRPLARYATRRLAKIPYDIPSNSA